MKTFLNVELIERGRSIFFKKYRFLDLIAITIKRESGEEYHAISKDFKLKYAWNKYEIEYFPGLIVKKNYWIRDKILSKVFDHLYDKYKSDKSVDKKSNLSFNFKNLKFLIKRYGKSNREIIGDIIDLCNHTIILSFKDSRTYYKNNSFIVENEIYS